MDGSEQRSISDSPRGWTVNRRSEACGDRVRWAACLSSSVSTTSASPRTPLEERVSLPSLLFHEERYNAATQSLSDQWFFHVSNTDAKNNQMSEGDPFYALHLATKLRKFITSLRKVWYQPQSTIIFKPSLLSDQTQCFTLTAWNLPLKDKIEIYSVTINEFETRSTVSSKLIVHPNTWRKSCTTLLTELGPALTSFYYQWTHSLFIHP